ncbi:hypothetical protein BJV82DRAFT_230460 [Fennellomyces sp. T-0311]|nr:hypothetical protein BJV82DRAFT_230460 [Fennellomyces sp. T-0311]
MDPIATQDVNTEIQVDSQAEAIEYTVLPEENNEMTATIEQQTYRMYVYDFKEKPCQLLGSTGTRYNTTVEETLEQESNVFQQKVDASLVHDGNNHFRNAKWSPDGCCLMSNSNDNVLRLFNLCESIAHIVIVANSIQGHMR